MALWAGQPELMAEKRRVRSSLRASSSTAATYEHNRINTCHITVKLLLRCLFKKGGFDLISLNDMQNFNTLLSIF